MPAGFDERERRAIRERLRAAALDALARGGLQAASVADLARSADIAKGSFYSFYPTKEHLFMEALESIEDEYRARFAAAVGGGGSAVERLERAFRTAFDMALAEPALRHLDSRTAERLARALPPDRVARHTARDAEAVERIASEWGAQGLLAPDVGAEDLAAAGYAAFLTAAGLSSFPKDLSDAVTRVMIRGLARALAPAEAETGPREPRQTRGGGR